MNSALVRPLILRLENVAEAVLKTLVRTDTTLIEFQSSTTFLAFAAMMFSGEHLFSNLPIYGAMQRFASERVWGLVCLLLGGVQSAANLYHHRHWRRTAAFGAACGWAFIAILIELVTPWTTALPVYAGFSLMQAIVYLRLSIPAPRPWVDPE